MRDLKSRCTLRPRAFDSAIDFFSISDLDDEDSRHIVLNAADNAELSYSVFPKGIKPGPF